MGDLLKQGMDAFNEQGGVKGLTDKFNEQGGVKGLTDKFNEAGGVKGLTDKFNEAGGALPNGLPGGLGDALKGGLGALKNGQGGEGGATPAADNNPSGNPAFKDGETPGNLDTQMTSLENKIHKTLENEIANNFESIINSILKNPTAQDTMTMAIASALKPTIDNAIANTSYLNEMANATGDKVKDGLLEFHREYSEKSEETKDEAFTSFIAKMNKIQTENVGQVGDAKKALDILGGDPNFKTNNNTGTRMGTVENQLKTIIPVDAINRKTKTVGGSRKRRQRRRTHKKKRFQPKK